MNLFSIKEKRRKEYISENHRNIVVFYTETYLLISTFPDNTIVCPEHASVYFLSNLLSFDCT